MYAYVAQYGNRGVAETSIPILSIDELLAERDARMREQKEEEERLKQKAEEREEDYRKRLDAFVLTEQIEREIIAKIKRTFDHSESELILSSFRSSFCSDGG